MCIHRVLFVLTLILKLVFGDGILYWYDTTQNRNNDFRMSNVPENTFIENSDSIDVFLNDDGGMMYRSGALKTLATTIQGETRNQFLSKNSNINFNNINYYENAKLEFENENSTEMFIQDDIVLVKDEDSFNAWTNLIDPSVTLTGFNYLDTNSTSYYNDKFFPVDGLGFAEFEQDNKLHNYYWCSRIRFLSRAPENDGSEDKKIILKLTASDDKFVFIDDQLVYSFIGITDKHEKEIILSNNNNNINNSGNGGNHIITKDKIESGQNFVMDIVNCNRKDRGDYHLLSIEANFQLFCD